MDKNKVFKSLENIKFVYESGRFNGFGHRYINNARFEESIKETEEQLSLQLKKAYEIKKQEENIINSAQENASNLMRETEEYIKNMDTVLEAKKIADAIIEDAQQEAAKLIEQGEKTKEKSIEYGEKVKSRLINQGYAFLETKVSTAMNSVESTINEIEKVKLDLSSAYEEVLSSLSVDESFSEDLEQKNA